MWTSPGDIFAKLLASLLECTLYSLICLMDFLGQSVRGVALTWDSFDPCNDPQTFFGGADFPDDEVHVVIF